MDTEYSQHPLVSYYDQISMMMSGFGDSANPNPETVRMVESITLSQLRLIIEEATKYTEQKELEPEYLVFLMRKNKHKMQRFLSYYIKHKQLKKKPSNMHYATTLPKTNLMEFIKYIDETGELTNLEEYDEVKFQRTLRADRISQVLDEAAYLKYSKARNASFGINDADYIKLKNWIAPGQKDIILSIPALEILSYYAYETVATIVDYAFFVRMDRKQKPDPFENVQGFYYNGPKFNNDLRFFGQNPAYCDFVLGQPAITVAEIREVMRRVCMPQAGKILLGKKLSGTHHIIAI